MYDVMMRAQQAKDMEAQNKKQGQGDSADPDNSATDEATDSNGADKKSGDESSNSHSADRAPNAEVERSADARSIKYR